MASLRDLKTARAQTEKSDWMTVCFWDGVESAGKPVQSGDGKPWRIHIRNAHCRAFKKAIESFNWQREVLLKLGLVTAEDSQAELADRAKTAAIGATEEYLDFEAQKFRDLLILDWENLDEEEGGPAIACTPENVRKYIFEEYPEVYDQVKAFAYNGAVPVRTPADLIADIEKKVLSGSSTAASSDLPSETTAEPIETDTPRLSDSSEGIPDSLAAPV